MQTLKNPVTDSRAGSDEKLQAIYAYMRTLPAQ